MIKKITNNRFYFTKDMLEFLILNTKNISANDLTILFNAEFRTKISVEQIRAAKKNHKITSGFVTRYKKGNIPYYKGTKGQVKPNKTSFKPGIVPHNYLPVGSELIKTGGYWWVKVQDPNVWKEKHRIVYEAAHGEIEKDNCIIFNDGNKLNTELENLTSISRLELLILNKKHLIKTDPKLTKTGILIAKVINKTNKMKEGINNEK